MNVRMHKDILQYKETMFMGLTMRQTVCSVLACGTAAALYFTLRDFIPTELLGWLCIIAAAPFAVLGFFRYHGMTAERLLLLWFQSKLMPEFIIYKEVDSDYAVLKDVIENYQKKELNKRHE